MSDSESTIATIVGNTPVNVAELPGLVDFKTEPGDVFIVTFPKTGTTWMQQICHQLRTGGHTEFEEISDERIVPWFECGPFVGIDVRLPQIAHPRCFKTHARLSELSYLEAAGSRYICTIRDPEATMVSRFKFVHSKHPGETEATDVNDWAISFPFLPQKESPFCDIWTYYLEIWKCRNVPHVLIVVFEKLKTDLASYIPKIASHIGLPAPSSDMQVKLEDLCSFDWMSKNDHLFDDHHNHIRLEAFKEQFPELHQQKAEGKSRVKGKGKGKGKGEGKAKGKDDKAKSAPKVGLQLGEGFNTKVNDETRALLAKAWRDHVTPVTGHQTYEDMAADLYSKMNFGKRKL